MKEIEKAKKLMEVVYENPSTADAAAMLMPIAHALIAIAGELADEEVLEGKIRLELETLHRDGKSTSHNSHEVDTVDQSRPGALLYQIGSKTVAIPWWRVVEVVTRPKKG